MKCMQRKIDMKKNMYSKGTIKVAAIAVVAIAGFVFVGFAAKPVEVKNAIDSTFPFLTEEGTIVKRADGINVNYIDTPKPLRALYMTSWVAGSPNIRPHVINLIDTTEVNAIVLDIKDDTGMISYEPSDPMLKELGNYENRIGDIRGFIKELHDKDIYVIGRVAVFQDPALTKDWPDQAVQRASDGAVWKDRKGISWMDAGSQKVWDYAIAIARDAHSQGFDEINFDYVRFPTDGNMKEISLPITGDREKSDVIEEFFTYLEKELRDEKQLVTSADLFGMVTTAQDDLGIGQVLEKVLPHVDYVAPMIYPSHYPTGFMGLGNPNQNVYQVIYEAMMGAKRKIDAFHADPSIPQEIKDKVSYDQMRPWLQDFDYGGQYGEKEVRAQMQAVYDTGLDSWLMWDPSNKYTPSAYNAE